MNTTERHRPVRLAIIAPLAACACCLSLSAAPQAALDIETLMTRVGERVADYYRRAQSIVGVERSTVCPINWNWTPDWFARTVESELRVEAGDGDGEMPEPKLIRNVLMINGRAPRERDLKDRSGCTDPDAASPEPLAFLLPGHRDEYRFVSIAGGKERNRAALVVEFKSANRTNRLELVEDPRGHPDCFDWTGPMRTRGRMWVDANTFEVLRVERHTEGPVEVRVAWKLQRRYNLPAWIVVDRDDLIVRYRPFAFSDPEEVILLPESLEALTIVRSGLQSVRRSITFNGYRRFLTKGRLLKP